MAYDVRRLAAIREGEADIYDGEAVVEIVAGLIDTIVSSGRNPSASNQQRYQTYRRTLHEVLQRLQIRAELPDLRDWLRSQPPGASPLTIRNAAEQEFAPLLDSLGGHEDQEDDDEPTVAEGDRQDSGAVIDARDRMLQIIYEAFAPTGEWPVFQHVSERIWSETHMDPREVYLDLAERELVHPATQRSRSFQLREDTQVAVTLLGLMHVDEAAEDLGRFVVAVRYIADRATGFRSSSPTQVQQLTVTSAQLRQELQLDVADVAILRLAALLVAEAAQLHVQAQGVGTPDWSLTVNVELARRYADIYDVTRYQQVASAEAARHVAPPPSNPAPEPHTRPSTNSRRVMVVHGRDRARDDLFNLLRALSLEPIEWPQAVKASGTTRPYTGQAVEAALANSQAAVVLLVEEEQVWLRADLRDAADPPENQAQWQPRPNVIYEAGMAVKTYPERTIILELGAPRRPTDLDGINTVRIRADPSWRHDLASRLRAAGCPVDTDAASDWLRVGAFAAPDLLPLAEEAATRSADNPPSRVELLRRQYKRGKALQASPAWMSGRAPASEVEAQEGTARKKKAVIEWTIATWRLLREHFPSHEEAFCPADPTVGSAHIWLLIEQEIESARDAEAYLRDKLAILARLVQSHDGPER